MEDKYGYNDIKDAFDNKSRENLESNEKKSFVEELMDSSDRFKAKPKSYPEPMNSFEEKKRFIYQPNEYEEPRKFYLVNTEEALEVKEKEISKEKKMSARGKALVAIAVSLGIAAGVVMSADLVNHPEDYLTTNPNFNGPATISEVIERTPQNLGIGGK